MSNSRMHVPYTGLSLVVILVNTLVSGLEIIGCFEDVSYDGTGASAAAVHAPGLSNSSHSFYQANFSLLDCIKHCRKRAKSFIGIKLGVDQGVNSAVATAFQCVCRMTIPARIAVAQCPHPCDPGVPGDDRRMWCVLLNRNDTEPRTTIYKIIPVDRISTSPGTAENRSTKMISRQLGNIITITSIVSVAVILATAALIARYSKCSKQKRPRSNTDNVCSTVQEYDVPRTSEEAVCEEISDPSMADVAL